MYFLVGAMLLYLPGSFHMIMESTFGYSNVLAADDQSNNMYMIMGINGAVGKPMTMIIYIIGLVSFIRGWMMIAKASSQGGSQQGSVGKGFMHVFGGILAMNIVGTLKIVNNTLYGS